MPKIIRYTFILFIIAGFATIHAADAPLVLETDWLKSEAGSTGKVLDSKVESVTRKDAEGVMVIDLSIPIQDPNAIDSIEVISRQSKIPVAQQKNWEWVKNEEDNQYDLRLFLPKKQKFEFRLRLIDNEKE